MSSVVSATSSLTFFLSSTVNVVASRSKLGRDEIKWQDLFAHFRTVQTKHEKARRVGLGGNPGPLLDGYSDSSGISNTNRPVHRRRITGEAQPPTAQAPSRAGALSPLNPRSRAGPGNGLINALSGAAAARPASPNAMLQQQQRVRRGLSITRK